MKRMLLFFLLVLCIFPAHAGEDGIRWKRDLMDGSRTGCTVPMSSDAAEAVGRVEGKIYYAPNGRAFRGGIVNTASLVAAAQPAMAPVREPLGYSAKEMVKSYPECALSNFFIDTIMRETERISGKKVDIGVANFGGIRVDMPAGKIIVDDIMSMFPFRNDIVYLTISGAEVRGLLESMAARGFQVLGGVRVVAEGGRLVSAEVGGEPLDDSRMYGMATISFLLDGGDNIALRQRASEVEVYPVSIYDVMSGFIRSEAGAGRAIDADADGRVKILDYKEAEAAKTDYGSLSGDGRISSARKLTILHTNDTHSHIDPVRGGVQNGLGGVIERAAYIDSVRRAAGRRNMLLLDAGDFSQGTSYFTILKGDLEVQLMNAMGYDVAALGNHEFDNGLDELARRLKQADFDVVCANYDFTGSPLEKLVRPYTIIRKGGSRIGIIGLLTDVTKVVDRGIADNMKYLDPVRTANMYASFLKDKKKCDIVICLSHLGFDGSVSDCTVAALSEDIDLIVGGHSHTDLESMVVRENEEGDDVIILQDGCWGIHVGNLEICPAD